MTAAALCPRCAAAAVAAASARGGGSWGRGRRAAVRVQSAREATPDGPLFRAPSQKSRRLSPVNSPGAGERQLRALAEGTRQGGLEREFERVRGGERLGAVKGGGWMQEEARGPLRAGEGRAAQVPVATGKDRPGRQRKSRGVDSDADVARSMGGQARERAGEEVQGDGAREACGMAGGEGKESRVGRGAARVREAPPSSRARGDGVARALSGESGRGDEGPAGEGGRAGLSGGAGVGGAGAGMDGRAVCAGGAGSGPATMHGRRQQPRKRASRRLQPGEVRSLARQLHTTAQCAADVDAVLAAALGESGEVEGRGAEAEERAGEGGGAGRGERVWVRSGVVVALMLPLADMRSWRAAMLLWQWWRQSPSYQRSPHVLCALLSVLARCNRVHDALGVFRAVQEEEEGGAGGEEQGGSSMDAAVYNAVICACGRAGKADMAVALLQEMIRRCSAAASPHAATQMNSAQQCSAESHALSESPTVPHTTSNSSTAHSPEERNDAGSTGVQRAGCWPTAATFGAVMHALCKAGRAGHAEALLPLMAHLHVRPTAVIFNTLLAAAAAAASDAGGRVQRVLVAMRAAGVAPTAATVTAVMGAHAARGDHHAVLQLWGSVRGGRGEAGSRDAREEATEEGREGVQERWSAIATGDPTWAAASAPDAGTAAHVEGVVPGRRAAVAPDAMMVTLVLASMARLHLVHAAEALWAEAEAEAEAAHARGLGGREGAGGDGGEGADGEERKGEGGRELGEAEGHVWRSKRQGRRAWCEDGGGGGGDARKESEAGAWQSGSERGRHGMREGREEAGRGGGAAWGRLDGMAAAAMLSVYVAAGDLYHALRFLLSAAAAGLLPFPGTALAAPHALSQAAVPHAPAPATPFPSALSSSPPPAAGPLPPMSPTPLNMVLAALLRAALIPHMDALLLCYLHSPAPSLAPCSAPHSCARTTQLPTLQDCDPAVRPPSSLPMPSHPPWARLPWDCPTCLGKRAGGKALWRGSGRDGKGGGEGGWTKEWEGEYGVRVSGGRQRSEAARDMGQGERDEQEAVGGGAGCCCCSSSGVVVSKGTCEVMVQGYCRAGWHARAAAVVQYMEEQGYRVSTQLLSLLPHA
ncbi:hypothetical protein CLOP_g12687 [Closterium sp. NIES-67]|nr:hypothetical protein CLOP_g12687 [Closterium sp. NIES-67]